MHPELTTKFREERGFKHLILLLLFTLKPHFQKTQRTWMVPVTQKDHLVGLYLTSFLAAFSDTRLFCWLLVAVTALKLKNVSRSIPVSHSYQQGRGTSFPQYTSCKLFHHSDNDSCRQKKNCAPCQSKPSKRWDYFVYVKVRSNTKHSLKPSTT